MTQIRVGLRGGAGLLGRHFSAAISKASDMRLVCATYKNDETFKRMVQSWKFGDRTARTIPEKMYLDEPSRVVDRVNDSVGGEWRFLPIEALNLKDECDVVVDAAIPTNNHSLQSQYQEFPGPIVLQDGCYPSGRLIAPPIVAPPQGGNKYRQGGCFLSGVVPVLAAFREVLRSVRIHLVMQYDSRENDFTIHERVNTFRLVKSYIPRMEAELSTLFPEAKMTVEDVVQIPTMIHYSVSLATETSNTISQEGVLNLLAGLPRVRVLPPGIMDTYPVNLEQKDGASLPPVFVFGDSLESSSAASIGSGSLIRMNLALYYRTLAVLPNIDAVRILVGGVEPMKAMRQTDREMGFSNEEESSPSRI